jgi:hypothetical protein
LRRLFFFVKGFQGNVQICLDCGGQCGISCDHRFIVRFNQCPYCDGFFGIGFRRGFGFSVKQTRFPCFFHLDSGFQCRILDTCNL